MARFAVIEIMRCGVDASLPESLQMDPLIYCIRSGPGELRVKVVATPDVVQRMAIDIEVTLLVWDLLVLSLLLWHMKPHFNNERKHRKR